MADPELARPLGLAAREHVLARYGLARFLDDWDRLLEASATTARGGSPGSPPCTRR